MASERQKLSKISRGESRRCRVYQGMKIHRRMSTLLQQRRVNKHAAHGLRGIVDQGQRCDASLTHTQRRVQRRLTS